MPLLARLLRPPAKEAAARPCRLVVVEESTEERGCGALLQLDAAAKWIAECGRKSVATVAGNRILPTEAVDIVQVNCLEREGRGDAGVFEEASAKVAAGPALLLIDDWAALCDGCGSWRAALPALDGLVTSGRFSAVCVVALRETVPAPALAALHRLARCSARAIAPSANATRVEERDAAAAVAQTRDVTCAVYAVVSETTV